ncbi:hypothetical protein KC19_VG222700 [Ceratodon purpureus]|uniref:Uncharacterized protein n=1 Tax=Ceratodon purpureus TaxID=3225 RepID=A0A8T0HSN1_CERPU|nr:hypothetical protein KC19_VG222700 [Ceratodon purpureus]
MPETVGSLANWDHRLPLVNEGLIIPTQVNYVGKAMMQDTNLMEVRTLSPRSLEPLGCGIACVSVVELMGVSVISTATQDFLPTCLTGILT